MNRMPIKRSIAVVALAIALLATAIPTPIAARDWLTGLVAIHALPDPGPLPAFDASEYENYRKSGTSDVDGWLYQPDDHQTSCGNDLVPALYPDTPFTRWIISTWVREIDGNGPNARFRFPGDAGTKITIPDVLNPFSRNTAVAVRFAACDQGLTHVTFHDVPPGRYVLVAFVEFWDLKSLQTDEFNLQGQPIGPSGPPITYWKERGGFALWSPSSITVEAGKNTSFTMSDLKTIARMRP